MKARGFEDAFIVTYKNGERISLNLVIKNTTNPIAENTVDNEILAEDSVFIDLKFTVQIMVSGVSVSALDMKRMSMLDNIDKQAKGSDMYEYYAGVFYDLNEASIQLGRSKVSRLF